MNKDEYIDYSCSTPLERLSRDVQTHLRSWHIISGSDRHVSFQQRKGRGLTRGMSVPNLMEMALSPTWDGGRKQPHGQGERQGQGQGRTGVDGERPKSAPLWSVGEDDDDDSEHKDNDETYLVTVRPEPIRHRSRSNPNPFEGGRGEKTPRSFLREGSSRSFEGNPSPPLQQSQTNTNSNNTTSYGGVKLIRSGKLTLTTTAPNSSQRQDRITVDLDLCLWDGPPLNTNRSASTNHTSPPPSSSLSSATIPLSLRTLRQPEQQEDVISNLSSLLGIGQHLTLTPSNPESLTALLDATIDALLKLNHPSGVRSSRPTQHRRSRRSTMEMVASATNTLSTAANTLTHAAVDRVVAASASPRRTPSSSSSSSSHFSFSSTTATPATTHPLLGNNPQDHVAVHSAALHSLSSQLQMALNVALSECDCRIPAFGIWGLYRPTPSFSVTSTNREKKREYLMAVPEWMNGGHLVELAEESSPCCALIRYLKKAEEEEKERLRLRNGAAGRINGNRKHPTTIEEGDNDDDDYDDHENDTHTDGNDSRSSIDPTKSDRSVEKGSDGGDSHHSHSTPIRRKGSRRSSFSFHHGSSFPSSPASLILQQSLSNSSKKGRRGEGRPNNDRLYLPAFLMGYCHSGPSLLAKGATFAIHVVPAGISYPVHCTTLNSLGQLLLQHCPPPSLVGGAAVGVSQVTSLFGDEREEMLSRDLSFYGKVEVVWARHKYTWSKLFEFQNFMSDGVSGVGSGSGSGDDWNVWTCNVPWRKCCDPVTVSNVFVGEEEEEGIEVETVASTEVLEYRKQCRMHALKMIYRIMALTKNGKRGDKDSSGKDATFEPLWGPINDPILSVSITVTWSSNKGDDGDDDGSFSTPAETRERGAPFLTLPLRIRSQRTMSSQDVLEMENTLLSTIFNPLVVPASDFSVLVTPDPYSRCNSLGANTRCILAALIRVSTLDTDVLLGNLTKRSVLQQMHDRKVGDEATEELMDRALVGGVTRKLVEIMDWSTMANQVSGEDSEFEEKLDAIVQHVMYGCDMRCYPNPPEGTEGMEFSEGAEFDFRKAESSGRLLSVLFSCMSGLRWPSAMARLWLKFVAELRLRWDDKKSLQNLGKVPGLDPCSTAGVNHAMTENNGSQQFKMIGHAAKFAAFVHSSEPSPNLYACLISQKLQVFNIGVETMIVKEEEEYRRQKLEEEVRLKNAAINEDSIDHDGDDTENIISCSQSEAATEVIGNTVDGFRAAGKGKFGGIQEDKEWCAQSEAATEVVGNTRCGTKVSGMGDSQIATTDTTVSGGNSFPIMSPSQPFRSMAEIGEDEESTSARSLSSSTDSRNIPMMFDPRENKFKPMADNNSGDIILNQQPNDNDMESSGTSAFYDAFTSIETDTFDNKSRYAISSNGGIPEIEDDFDYEFTPFEEAAVSVANRSERKGIRCPVHGAYLVASSDQVYAPYLQRPDPVTDQLILERRKLLSSSSVKSRLEVAHSFEKGKLHSDMSAFKAANPGAVFHDFVLWYGNPENPLQLHDDEVEEFFCCESNGKSPDKEAEEAAFVLERTRQFWSDTWDEAEPIPASQQIPLFDAFKSVEMILGAFEYMHPANLLNQILAVNFSMADFILSSSKPVHKFDIVDTALKQLSHATEKVLKMLRKDQMNCLKDRSASGANGADSINSFSQLTPETVAACESLCGQIGNVESLLSRVASLLTKFSGDVNLVRKVIENPECQYTTNSYASRSGILNGIQCQQQRNSGDRSVAMDDLPLPSVREYILRNRDDCNPCQLTVSIGGTHGLEKGGTNSTKGGLVLALNKCVSGAH